MGMLDALWTSACIPRNRPRDRVAGKTQATAGEGEQYAAALTNFQMTANAVLTTEEAVTAFSGSEVSK